MKKLLVILMMVLFSTVVFAESQEQYSQMLKNGKVKLAQVSSIKVKNGEPLGLGYTQTELGILESAISFGIDKECEPCEMMKEAINQQYHAYDTIKLIYSKGGDVKLDQLCMCAVEQGIQKTIIVQAMVDAVNSYGKPRFDRDEVIQSQCLGEGLGYTQAMTDIPRIKPPVKQQNLSTHAPSN